MQQLVLVLRAFLFNAMLTSQASKVKASFNIDSPIELNTRKHRSKAP
jgi:hypothetical protein